MPITYPEDSQFWENLVLLQIKLEYRLRSDGAVEPYPGSTERARFIIYRHAGGFSRFYSHDLPPPVRGAIKALTDEDAFMDQRKAMELLARHEPCESVFQGEACAFDRPPDAALFPDAVILNADHLPLLEDGGVRPQPSTLAALKQTGEAPAPPRVAAGVVIAGELVALCESIRESEAAAEAWAQTPSGQRRRGYGTQAVAAWAAEVLRLGKVPFYSYRAANTASSGLARKLGLTPFAQVIAYD